MDISHRDRGLNYGDGFFTTVKVDSGELSLWDYHVARLQECEQRLGFPPLDYRNLTNQCIEIAKQRESGFLKVLITRGCGGRGYGVPEEPCPEIVITQGGIPTHYQDWQIKGVSLDYSEIQLGHQPLFAGLKTLNRLEQVMIKQAARKNSSDDVLVEDISGHVIESSASNILVVKNGIMRTPKLDMCGISGVYLRHLCNHNEILEGRLKRADLAQADVIFICNSLMGLVPVKALDKQVFDVQTALQLKEEIDPSK
ncbi:aminodeoxychorismate lyase [Pseudoalteromonas luteoviolacea]|uniref:Aminodeoxychorismate lyase n=1 Tax=Pseudoalteromonas luteoviolacea TaxID=43657 RepID=A0A1C0TT70_9GAMM|nr:aminodeoxychorismate lyase [Pseudoalteromonas luteoviolacea]MBQ4810987.1 aminodeoxychorismate lyase [Pseudoalteromonas luteoviolacea]OCQ22496.1 aminodeoxychorismate lyase [Pseudoalteromonas luteoviolacea]